MKVALVAQNFPPEFRGGVERVVEVTAIALRAIGHEVLVICGSEQPSGSALHEERREGFTVLRLTRPPRPLARLDLTDVHVGVTFERLLREHGIELVHLHHWWNLSDDLARRAARLGLPVVASLHDHFTGCPRFFRLREPHEPCDILPNAEICGPCAGGGMGLESVAGRAIPIRQASFAAELDACGRILAPSRTHAEAALRPFPELGDRLEVVPLGAHGVRAVDHAPEPGAPFTILHFGHLSRLKGLAVLLEAVRRVRESGRAVRLLLLGSCLEDDLDLSEAEHVSEYDRDRLMREAARSDCAVFPSLALESYGLVVDEALALGLPVIVSDRGALAERIGTRGVVVAGDDVAALAQEIEAAVDDPSRVAGWRAGTAPGTLDAAAHARELTRIYETVEPVPRPESEIEDHLARRLTFTQNNLLDALGALLGR